MDEHNRMDPQEEVTPEKLIEKALEAQRYAYVPYSEFHVGAAVLADNGRIYTGCNIENSSYGATICAERTAIGKAVSEGARQILAIAITSDSEVYTMPCGICRQVMSEFCSSDMPLYLSDRDGRFQQFKFSEILPHCFHLTSE
jgi:cytidine deaminase